MLSLSSIALRRVGSRASAAGKRSMHYGNRIGGQGNEVIWVILGINGAVFAGWYLSKDNWNLRRFMNQHFLLSQIGVFREKRFHTMVTSFFSHFDTMHFLGNMLVLFSFGSSTIPILGSARFLAIYMGGGLVSSVGHLTWPYIVPRSWPSSRSDNRFASGLGASGAINAIVMYNILSFPRSVIYLYGVVPIPAALLGLGFIAIDGYGLYKGEGAIGNAAHLGGAAFGAAAFAILRRRFR